MKRIGEILGLDAHYFLKNGFWIGLRYGMISFFGLALSVGFARLGTKELLGQYQFILSFIGIFSLFSLPGLNVSALKSVVRGSGNGVIREGVRLSFLSSLVVIPIIFSYVGYRFFLQETMEINMAVALLVAGVLFPFFYAPNTWYVAYEGKSLFRPVAIRTIAASFTTTAIVLLGLYAHSGVELLIFLYLFLSSAFSWYYFSETLRNQNGYAGTTIPLDIPYGFKVTVQKFIYGLLENIPPIALSFFLGFEFLAVFQIAYFFTNATTGLMGALFAMYLPKLFTTKDIYFKRSLGQSLLLGVISFFGLLVILKLTFFLLYGESYRESYIFAWMLAPILILSPFRIFLVNLFTAKGKNTLISVFCVVAHIIGITVFLLIKDSDKFLATTLYLYTLTCCIILFLTIAHMRIKVASAEREMLT